MRTDRLICFSSAAPVISTFHFAVLTDACVPHDSFFHMLYVLWILLFPHRLVATDTVADDSCHNYFLHLSICPTTVVLGVTLAYITTMRYTSITIHVLDNLTYPKGIILRVDITDHRCVQRCLQSVWSVQAFPKHVPQHLHFQWGESLECPCPYHFICLCMRSSIPFHSIGVAVFSRPPNSKLSPTS